MSRSIIRRIQAAIALAALVAVSSMSAAAETDAAPTDVDKEAAIHFQQGIDLYKQNQFEEASIEFTRAYELKPNFKILFNIGQAENMLGHFARALGAYLKYVSDGGAEIPADRRKIVDGEISRLEFLVGRVEVRCETPGAVVLIDGEERGKTPLAEPVLVDLGKREVEVLKNQERLFRQVYRVAGGQWIAVDIAAPTPDKPSTGESTPPPPEPKPAVEQQPDFAPSDVPAATSTKRRKVFGGTALGIGAAIGIGAIVTGVMALTGKQKIEDGCDGNRCDRSEWQSEFDRVERLNLTTDVLIGVTSAAVLTGVLLLAIKPKSERASAASGGVSSLYIGALTLGGRF